MSNIGLQSSRPANPSTKMANTSDEMSLHHVLLTASGKHNSLKPLLDEVLPEIRALLPASGLAVVRPNPPKWEVQAASGVTERDIPLDLVADAVDRDGQTTAGDWIAASLGGGYAVVARRVANQAAFAQ